MIEKECYIEAPPHVVYAFLTEPDKMLEWIGTDVQLDPRRGGIFRIVPNTVDVVSGTFLEATPFTRVSFTWGFDGEGHGMPSGSTIVDITLEPEGTGTRLRLTHRNVIAEFRDRHESGWEHYLARLGIVAAGETPEPDPYAAPSHRHG